MRRLVPYGWLLFIGISWGATQPLAKIAVSSGYQPLGLIFWQMSISAVVLGLVNMIRGRPLPINRRVVPFYLAIALIGTIIPNAASYKAYTVLPAGDHGPAFIIDSNDCFSNCFDVWPGSL